MTWIMQPAALHPEKPDRWDIYDETPTHHRPVARYVRGDHARLMLAAAEMFDALCVYVAHDECVQGDDQGCGQCMYCLGEAALKKAEAVPA